VFDALPGFLQLQRSGGRLYGTVDPHLTPQGHDVLERLVEPLVVARLAPATGRAALVPAH